MHELLVGIDWGSSNRRAYLVDTQGRCLARAEDELGLLAGVTDYPAALQVLLDGLKAGPRVPVVMSGMVGSAGGWQPVPYLETDTALARLGQFLAPVPGMRRSCMIVPGYCRRGAGVDVMRGEETQLFGALALGQHSGDVVLPGTHSKWAHLEEGHITRWSTYMTGELFAALASSGTLASLLKGTGSTDGDAFQEGIEQAQARRPLSHSLFAVRAAVVSGAMPAARARDMVSGLLIGAEFADAGPDTRAITLIGAAALCQRYAQAAASFGIATTWRDPDVVYCAALHQFLTTMNAHAA